MNGIIGALLNNALMNKGNFSVRLTERSGERDVVLAGSDLGMGCPLAVNGTMVIRSKTFARERISHSRNCSLAPSGKFVVYKSNSMGLFIRFFPHDL